MYYRPKIVFNDPQEDQSLAFVKYFASRVINNNKNFLCAVTGQTGSGKSWLTGSIGEKYREMTGKPFDPKVHTVFSLKELMNLIKNRDQLEPCTFLHFDEPQVTANSRDWQSESNKILNTLTSTFRNMRLVVFFATPYLEFLDKQTRILFHAEIKVNGFDKKNSVTYSVPRLLHYDPKKDNIWRMRLKVYHKIQNKSKMGFYHLQKWDVGKPSQHWINIYEPMKADFTARLNQELAARLDPEARKKEKETKGRDEFIKMVQIYKEHGENWGIFLQEFPEQSITNLQQKVRLIKRQEKLGIPLIP